MTDGVPISGWFDFGAPPVGAFTFDFHDDDNGIVIGNLYLYTGGVSIVSTIDYETLTLDQYPLMFIYDKAKWEPSQGESGSQLNSKAMPTCTIQARLPSQPKGVYKSPTDVGNSAYEIYG